jgi:hypothetical protein
MRLDYNVWMYWIVVYIRKPDGQDHLGETRVDGRIIFRSSGSGIDWVDLADDKDRRGPLVCPVTNLRVP